MTKTNEKQIFMYYIFLQYIKKLYIDYLNQLLVLSHEVYFPSGASYIVHFSDIEILSS